MKPAGKNAIVTGAAKRLGREIALALAKKGVNIAIHYNKSKKEAEELADQIRSKGLKSTTVQADISKPNEITKAVEKAGKGLGSLDILINNAAIFYPTPLEKITEEDWNAFLDINLKSQFFFAREFARHANSPAKIINMADGYGWSPSEKFIPYGVSKAGVVALTKGLAKAYAPEITVNCICPGPVLPLDDTNEASQKKAIMATLLKKEGTVEDIIKTVVFLIENDYITGQAICVDGGKSI